MNTILVDDELATILGKLTEEMLNSLKMSQNITEFTEILQEIVDVRLRRNSAAFSTLRVDELINQNMTQRLMREIEEIGWEHILDVDEGNY